MLDELSGPVCDAVLDRPGSALMLSGLAQASPLLRPVDPAHERFRWHGLFRDALGAELRRTAPEDVRSLHDRASAWFEEHGDPDHAIAHAVYAHDPVRAGDLLCAGIVAYITQGRNELVQDWLAGFSREELAGHAPLALAGAHSFLAAGNAAEARHLTVAAAAAVGRGPAAGARSLSAGLAVIEATVGRHDVGAMGEVAGRACEREPEDSPWRPISLFLRGTSLHLTGDRVAAAPVLDEGADLGETTAPAVTSLCLAQAAMIAIEQRDWDTAAELTDRARNADRGAWARRLSDVCLGVRGVGRDPRPPRTRRRGQARSPHRDRASRRARRLHPVVWGGGEDPARARVAVAGRRGGRAHVAGGGLAARAPDVPGA